MKRSAAALIFGIICGFIFLILMFIELDVNKDLLLLISLLFSITSIAVLLLQVSSKKNKPK